MVAKARHILLLAAITSAGCCTTDRDCHFLPEHACRAESDDRGLWCTLTPVPRSGRTAFRHRALSGYLFTWSMWSEAVLEFAIPSDRLVAGTKVEFAELDAWSLARPYDTGAGLLADGHIRVLSVRPDRIELSVTSSRLPDTLQGTRAFRRAKSPWPADTGMVESGSVKE